MTKGLVEDGIPTPEESEQMWKDAQRSEDSRPAPCSPVTSDELWSLRQKVLGVGIGDPWDGEELEEGYVRLIPEGFEDAL